MTRVLCVMVAHAVARAKLDAVADGVIVCARRCDCLSVGGVICSAVACGIYGLFEI